MKILLAGAAAIALISVAAPASAETYGTVGYSQFSADAGIAGTDVDLGALTVRGGWRPEGSVFGIEAEASVGVDDDSVPALTGTNITGDAKLRNQYGIYATAQFPVTPQINVFGRVGFGTSDVQVKMVDTTVPATPTSGSVAFDSDSVNYGIGGTYMIDGVNGVRLDLSHQDFKGGGDANAVGLSFLRNF